MITCQVIVSPELMHVYSSIFFEGIHVGHIEGLIGRRLQYLGPLSSNS